MYKTVNVRCCTYKLPILILTLMACTFELSFGLTFGWVVKIMSRYKRGMATGDITDDDLLNAFIILGGAAVLSAVAESLRQLMIKSKSESIASKIRYDMFYNY